MASIRTIRQFLRNAWDKEPVIVLSIAMGAFGFAAMYASPYTYKQEEEMKNWPNIYNFYDLPMKGDRIYEHMSTKLSEQPVWRTDYED